MEKAPNAFRIISEVADELDVPQHVLRFWESRFSQIKPMKRGGGRRYYRPEDIDLLRGIRHLLYSEGYTIRGVQRLLREQGIGFVQSVWRPVETDEGVADDNLVEAAAAGGKQPRARLLNLLPGFRRAEEDQASGDIDAAALTEDDADFEIDNDEEDDADADAPRREPPPMSVRSAVPSGTRLSPEHLARLQSALEELGECRRLIDEVLLAPLE